MKRRPSPARRRSTRTGPSAQGWLLPHLIRWVEAQQADAAGIRDAVGSVDLSDPDLRVPDTVIENAWRAAAAAAADRAIGIHVAEFLPRGAFDLVEYAFRASESLGAAIERLARYGRVISDRVAARMELGQRGLYLVVSDTAPTPMHPARAEFAIAITIRLARECAGADLAPRLVCFAHHAPGDTTEYERFFRGRVEFNSGTNSLVLDAADASRALQDADEALQGIVQRRLDKALRERELDAAAPLSAAVHRAIVKSLGRIIVTPGSVAQLFGVSRRTMARRLAQERTSFSEILEQVRKQLAQAMVRDGSLSVADIAFFLQYSEPSAFHRSFRRWTGTTPRAYRSGASQS